MHGTSLIKITLRIIKLNPFHAHLTTEKDSKVAVNYVNSRACVPQLKKKNTVDIFKTTVSKSARTNYGTYLQAVQDVATTVTHRAEYVEHRAVGFLARLE